MSQPDSSDRTESPAPRGGYCQALKTGFQETTLRVQEMHQAIAHTSFHVLRQVPGLGQPVALTQKAHRLIADGVYAAIRHSGGGLLSLAAWIEQHAVKPASSPAPLASRRATVLQSAINAAVGDFLASSANPLAIHMGFYTDGQPLPLAADGLRDRLIDPSDRLCVFIHGLGCDEQSWRLYADTAWDPPGQDYGQRLHAELRYTPLYLRYNTGLPIADNGEQLARLLDLLLAVYPLPVRELVLIGHSMGGLVARSACEQAAATHQTWPGLTRMVICLGSPHQGAPLEKLGQLTTVALGLSSLVAPLGKIANARSAGIKDLRHGLRATGTPPGSPGIAYRLIGASLTQRIDHPIGQLLGDGLVTLGSATATDLADDVDTVRLGGLHHMELLNTPRVYRHIHDWLAMPEQSTAPET